VLILSRALRHLRSVTSRDQRPETRLVPQRLQINVDTCPRRSQPGIDLRHPFERLESPVALAAAEQFATTSTRDTYWPRAAVAMLVTSFVLVLAAVQLVSPTRRWRIFRRRTRREALP